jgi:hypothetical protein
MAPFVLAWEKTSKKKSASFIPEEAKKITL